MAGDHFCPYHRMKYWALSDCEMVKTGNHKKINVFKKQCVSFHAVEENERRDDLQFDLGDPME